MFGIASIAVANLFGADGSSKLGLVPGAPPVGAPFSLPRVVVSLLHKQELALPEVAEPFKSLESVYVPMDARACDPLKPSPMWEGNVPLPYKASPFPFHWARMGRRGWGRRRAWRAWRGCSTSSTRPSRG